MDNIDYLFIGGGIVGLTMALEIKKRKPESKILIVEKEAELGKHSSGRNSGVLHSGIYYPPGTLKAKLCKDGAKELAQFHQDHRLMLKKCGKILLVTNQEDDSQIDLLADRAKLQGIKVDKLDKIQLAELEPKANSVSQRALFVHSTSVGDPQGVLQKLKEQLKQHGISIEHSARITSIKHKEKQIQMYKIGKINYGHIINTAGLYADRIAHHFECAHRYTILPFKGIYWKLDPASGISFNHLLYPVPDLRVPFLGVHTTTTISGETYIGPTAVPAFGRENYAGFQDINLKEATRISIQLMKQYMKNNDGFRRLAWQEGRRVFKPWFTKAAQKIVPSIEKKHLLSSNKVGIRAQLLDRTSNKLVNDFLVEKGTNSTHILNAISPAWTSSFPFARYVCDNYLN